MGCTLFRRTAGDARLADRLCGGTLVGVTALGLLFAAAPPAGAVVNGKPVTEQDWFAHAVVGLIQVDKDGKQSGCTGTMLTHRLVLTAAHCVHDAKSVTVVFDLTTDGMHRVVATRQFVHPDFKPAKRGTSAGDLAIISLPPHDYPTTAVSLDGDENFTQGQQFTIVGYGRSDAKRWRSNGTMRKAAIVATGHQTPKEVGLTPIGGAWPCRGDSGAPILRKDYGGHYALTGVLSGGNDGPQGECTTSSFMTPIHGYLDWIKSTMAQAE